MYNEESEMPQDSSLGLAVKKTTIDNAKSMLSKIIKTKIVPFLWGPPGIGKSSLIAQICKEDGYVLIDLRLSLLSPVDLRGLPMLDKENNTAKWLPPSFLPPQESKEKGILFLDEINLAPPSVQSAAFQLILDKRIGEYTFPENWRIVAAGNREVDKSNVFKLSAPLMNRFIHLEITEDLKTWMPWARENTRPEIVSFLETRPNLLLQMPNGTDKAFPSPRTWKFLSEIIDCFDYQAGTEIGEDLEKAIIGTIGKGAGEEFIKFTQNYDMQKIGQMITAFKNGEDITMPKDEDSRYAIINAILKAFLDREITKARVGDLKKKLSAEEKMTIDHWERAKGI